MSLFPPTKTPAPLPGSAVLPKEKGRFIFVCFTPVSVRFCCAIVAFLVFQLFHPLDERQRVPGQIVPGPPGCHRLQREGAVPERKRVERHRVVQVFQQLAAQEADAVPVGGQRRGRPDVAAFQNFGRMQAAAPQLLQNILALPLGLVLQQQGLPLQPLPGKAALPGGSLLQRVSLAEHGVHPVPAQHPVAQTVMAEHSSDAIDWLTSIGAPLPKVAATGGTTHKYLHEPEDGSAVGSYLVEKLNAQAEKLGVQILLNTKATEILTNDGAACGIKAESTEHDYTINAKSVIIAAGGFGANFELMASFNPALANAVTTNHAGATGDGILMAEAIGADTVDMDQIQLHPTVYQETGMLVSESVRSMGGILVNAEGKRFCNDMSTRDAVSNAELEQPGAYAYIIFDQRIVDDLKSCQKYISNGLTVSSDSYEGLAKEMGLTGDAAANFVETMNTWNASVAAGEDAEFGRSNGMDGDLSTAPYYAIKIAPGIHHTMGGLKINTDAQVLDTDGSIIPGLYAAGETTGGVHGGNRIGGNAVCDFVVFGRIAGSNASAYAAA